MIGKIIATVIAIPVFITLVLKFALISWIKGLLTGSILNAFGVHPIIGGMVSVFGILVLIIGIIKLGQVFF